MTKVRQAFGAWGEGIAAEYLLGSGMILLDRNWRCRDGEVDIIAREAETIVFCEVKTRRSRAFGPAVDAVVGQKARRLRRLAAHWLALREAGSVEVRFDVICVMPQPQGPPEIDHLRGALT
ncbi:putative endonuclease [Allocatelliglobosispora scoriae]|uniref:UPF0102 protein F4553_005669 n=1 Tax=Allocatelliglobosispora scoriae TaxID=643052 RepID=A0A841BX37_9ACTN|nr:YraN family protein [Allocatelliglobosispora scoriae]MBB5872235.1 putative endonuclease [Allocatelliglobosispora scoriae]